MLKQLKLIHKITMTPDEIKLTSESLKANAAECMQIMIEQIAVFGFSFDSEDHKVIEDRFLKHGIQLVLFSVNGECRVSV